MLTNKTAIKLIEAEIKRLGHHAKAARERSAREFDSARQAEEEAARYEVEIEELRQLIAKTD